MNSLKDIFLENKNKGILSVGLDVKRTNGVCTGEVSITFKVKEKKKPEELHEDLIISDVIELNGVLYRTDVVESPGIIALSEAPPIDYTDPFDDWRYTPNLPSESLVRPLQGGVKILHSFTGEGGWTLGGGTLGVLCKDNDTGALCGLTNAHVATRIVKKITERTIPQTAYDESSTIFEQGYSKIGRPYKIRFISEGDWNTVDCGLVTIDASLYNVVVSRKQLGMSFSNVTKFASTAELDSITYGKRLYSSGGSTQAKGEVGVEVNGRLTRTKLFAGNSSTVIVSGFRGNFEGTDYFSAYFSDVIQFFATETDEFGEKKYGATFSGDSGSAVFAEFGGEMKVIGLVFAGDGYDAYCCRIDNICNALNISEWPANGSEQNQLLPTINSNNPEYIDIEGLSDSIYKDFNGKRYWNVGTVKK